MNIYLKLEIKNRDFLSRLLLGMYCASKGNDVLIGDDKIIQNIENGVLKPGIFLEKSITPASSRISQLKNLKKKKFVIFSLDEESGLLPKKYDSFKKSRFSKKSLKLTDKVLCWGKFDFKELKNYYKLYKNKFVLTGNPRVDLWKSKFDKLFTDKKIKEENSVLISSNFLIGVSKKRTSDYIKMYRKLGYFENQKIKEYFNDFHILFSFKLMLKFTELINYLSKKYPKVQFILRPHPNEDEEIWKKMLNERKNLIVTKSKNIAYWMIRSKLIIHNGCMGGIEAFARNKSVLSYRPVQNKFENDFVNSISNQAYNIKQVDQFINKIFNKKIKKKIPNSSLKNFNNRFGNLNSQKLNFQEIYKEFNKFDSPILSNKNSYFKISFKGVLRKLKRLFMKKIENPKFQTIEFDELENSVNKYKTIIPELNNVKFKILDENIIRIYGTN